MKNKLIWLDDTQVYITWSKNHFDALVKAHGICMPFIHAYNKLLPGEEFNEFVEVLLDKYVKRRAEYEAEREDITDDVILESDNIILEKLESDELTLDCIKHELLLVYQNWVRDDING